MQWWIGNSLKSVQADRKSHLPMIHPIVGNPSGSLIGMPVNYRLKLLMPLIKELIGSSIRIAPLIFAALLVPTAAGMRNANHSRTNGSTLCGTSASRDRDAIVKGKYQESRLRTGSLRLRSSLTESMPLAADVGDVAVLEDDGSMVIERNFFDLANRSFRYQSTGADTYQVVGSSATFSADGGTPIILTDDDSKEIELGFSFVFYGESYTSIHVNSDGNLTFLEPDAAHTERDLGRFSSGPPRIGPLFVDLDPGAGGVSARAEADGITFIWNGVPNYASITASSFSVKLFQDGSLEFVYGIVESRESIVGISPGGGEGGISAVDYREGLPTSSLGGTIVEIFTTMDLISESQIAKRFFQNHPDEFDQLVVFLAFDYDLTGNAFAYEINVKNDIAGIGLPDIDFSGSFGSDGKLKSFVMMGSLDGPRRFPSDPGLKFFRQSHLTYNTLEVLAHEVGHRWLAYPFVEMPATDPTSLLFDTDFVHWSFFFNANASVMEGNLTEDRGPGLGTQRYRVIDATSRYSKLDLYLMGLERAEDVPGMFFVENPNGTFPVTRFRLPQIGVTFGGTRRNFAIDNIIQANGPRNPPHHQSQRVHRQAFILITRPGEEASPEQIAKLQNIADAWVPFFNEITQGAGWAVTSLQTIPGTTPNLINFPHFQGSDRQYTGFALANWGSTPADVLFRTFDNDGNTTSTPEGIKNPRMITIGPGSQIAMLGSQIYGLSLSDPRNGWVQAEITSSQVNGFFLAGDIVQTMLDGAVADSRTSQTLYFTRADVPGALAQGGSSNTFDIINPNSAEAHVSLDYVDETGTKLATVERTLNPGQRLSEELEALFGGVAQAPQNSYVSITSDVGVVGYQSIKSSSAVFALPAQSPPTGTRIYSAQFASGLAGTTRYFTDINLVNTSSQTLSIEILLVGNDGVPVTAPNNPVNTTLEPSGQLNLPGDILFGLADPVTASSLTEGSLVVTADAPGIIGDVLFGDPLNRRFLASLPLNGKPLSDMVLSQVAQGSPNEGKPYFTGIAFYNPNPDTVQVSIRVFSERGEQTGAATFTLQGGNRLSRTLPELVPEIAEQIRGHIRISSSGGEIVVFELFGDQQLEFLAAVPPQPINQ